MQWQWRTGHLPWPQDLGWVQQLLLGCLSVNISVNISDNNEKLCVVDWPHIAAHSPLLQPSLHQPASASLTSPLSARETFSLPESSGPGGQRGLQGGET